MPLKPTQGYLRVLGFQLFYKSFGESRKGTLLCLHGGPGMTHDYILPLSELAKNGYRVVFYDQLGCGKSDLPKNVTLFTVERAVEEVEAFRRGLKLGRIHLMGSSYGGLLAIAYALRYQANLKSLITTGGLASVPLAISEMEAMKKRLPKDVQLTLRKYEEEGDFENPEYLQAVMVFYKKHLCRLEKWPPEITYSINNVSRPVYHTMNGPNEFTILGNLRYWDVTPQLPKIHVPTLVTGGRYDEVSPKVAASIHRGIKGSRLAIFEKSSHLPMWEERAVYLRTVRDFLNGAN